MSYILLALYTALLLLVIYKTDFFKSDYLPKYTPLIVFVLKFIGGTLVYLVYAYFYGSRMSGDIFKYFDDGNIIYTSMQQNPIDYLRMLTGIGGQSPHLDQYYDTCRFWHKEFNYGLINDNRIVIRFNALVRLISLGNFHVHTLVISFLSFSGLWAIFKLFEQSFSKQKWMLLMVVFFFPSLYFWSSGVLKEGILMFAFGMFLYNIYKVFCNNAKLLNYMWSFLAAFILLLSKFYVLVAVLPGLIFFVLIRKTNKQWFYTKMIIVVLVFITIAWFSEVLFGYSLPETIAQKQIDFVSLMNKQENVGSRIEIPRLEPNIFSILINSPSAFFRTLFRPSVFEITNLMSLMAVVENLIIIFFVLITALFFKKDELKNEAFWFSVLFVLVLFTLSGLTTPVLGALVRYKAPALPFLGIAFMYLINFNKINSALQKIRQKVLL